jgi:hypothetical protein
MQLRITRLTALIGIAVLFLPELLGASENVLGPRHYGKVKFGVQIESVERLLGQKAEHFQRAPECDFVTFRNFPNARFIVENGVITRADSKGPILTETKVRMGMTLSLVKHA